MAEKRKTFLEACKPGPKGCPDGMVLDPITGLCKKPGTREENGDEDFKPDPKIILKPSVPKLKERIVLNNEIVYRPGLNPGMDPIREVLGLYWRIIRTEKAVQEDNRFDYSRDPGDGPILMGHDYGIEIKEERKSNNNNLDGFSTMWVSEKNAHYASIIKAFNSIKNKEYSDYGFAMDLPFTRTEIEENKSLENVPQFAQHDFNYKYYLKRYEDVTQDPRLDERLIPNMYTILKLLDIPGRPIFPGPKPSSSAPKQKSTDWDDQKKAWDKWTKRYMGLPSMDHASLYQPGKVERFFTFPKTAFWEDYLKNHYPFLFRTALTNSGIKPKLGSLSLKYKNLLVALDDMSNVQSSYAGQSNFPMSVNIEFMTFDGEGELLPGPPQPAGHKAAPKRRVFADLLEFTNVDVFLLSHIAKTIEIYDNLPGRTPPPRSLSLSQVGSSASDTAAAKADAGALLKHIGASRRKPHEPEKKGKFTIEVSDFLLSKEDIGRIIPDLKNFSVKKFKELVHLYGSNNAATAASWFPTTIRTIPRKVWDLSKFIKEILDFDKETFEKQNSGTANIGQYANLFKIDLFDEGVWLGEQEQFINQYGKFKNFQDFLTMIFSIKIRDLVLKKRRTFADIVKKGTLASNEPVFYRIAKYNSTGEIIQNFYLPHPISEKDVIKFADTQVKYGSEYFYRISVFQLVYGMKYKYTAMSWEYAIDDDSRRDYSDHPNDEGDYSDLPDDEDDKTGEFGEDEQEGSEGSEADETDPISKKSAAGKLNDLYLTVKHAPHLVIVEEPFFEFSGVMIDRPPMPPCVEFVPYKDINNKILIFINRSIGEKKEKPISINPGDERIFNNFKRKAGIKTEEILFRTDDISSAYEIYRIDFLPRSYTDFAGNLKSRVESPALGSFMDKLMPNKKYYYTFRTIDIHEHFSNPSPIYEVELRDDHGFVVPMIRIVEPHPEKDRTHSRNFKKFIQISPSLSQLLLDEASISRAKQGKSKDLSLGIGKSIWDKKYKIRITSKNTGRKMDLNLKFDYKFRNTKN